MISFNVVVASCRRIIVHLCVRKPPALLMRTNEALPFESERNGASHRWAWVTLSPSSTGG